MLDMNSSLKIIFFDGYCGLCDRFVTQIFLMDHEHRFQFAPLQGPTASRLLNPRPAADSVVYFRDGKVLTKSQAVLEIFSDLGGIYSVSKIFKIVPRFLNDSIYDWVARHRYGWFGQSEICRLPNETEKSYFLD